MRGISKIVSTRDYVLIQPEVDFGKASQPSPHWRGRIVYPNKPAQLQVGDVVYYLNKDIVETINETGIPVHVIRHNNIILNQVWKEVCSIPRINI